MKKVGVIHTSLVSIDVLKGLFKEIIPNVQMINIIDDSLLQEVKSVGNITPQIVSRICTYAKNLQDLGVDVILNQCSSVGEAASIARTMVTVPIVKIDEPMGQRAVSLGSKIGVVATVASTVKPSTELVREMAKNAGKEVKVSEYLVDGAIDILMKGDVDEHNRLVLAEIEKAHEENDVVVLAQGSMVAITPLLAHFTKDVLTSPRMAVERIKEILGE